MKCRNKWKIRYGIPAYTGPFGALLIVIKNVLAKYENTVTRDFIYMFDVKEKRTFKSKLDQLN
jgi:hypothetical protein